jgi:hypothetical protein
LQAGIGICYNISSINKAPGKIRAKKFQLEEISAKLNPHEANA